MPPAPSWRVAIITVLPAVAQAYAGILRAEGHQPVAVITPRRRAPGEPPMPFAAAHVADDPEELDILFASSKRSLVRLLRACEPDLALPVPHRPGDRERATVPRQQRRMAVDDPVLRHR